MGNAPESAACQAMLPEAGTTLVSPLVARRGRFRVAEITIELLETARQVQRQYAGLDLDLADGVNVALAAEYRTCSVLTLDRRDFRAIRPLTPHPAFRLLPDDM